MYLTLLVFSVVLFAGVVLIYVHHPAASIYHPATFYLAFHGLVYVIRPIFAWYFDFRMLYLAIGFVPTQWDKVQVLLATNLALIVFMAVALRIAHQPVQFRQDAADLKEREALMLWFTPMAIPIFIGGILSLWWAVDFRLTGDMMTYVDPYTGESALTSTNGYFLGLGSMLGGATVVIAYLCRFRWWSLMPFALYVGLRFASGIRGGAITVAVTIALLYLFDKRKKWPTVKFVIPALLAITAFNMVQQDRGMAIRAAIGLDTRNDYYSNTDGYKYLPLETMDLANMEFFEYLVGVVPEKTGTYDYFLQNLQLVVAPIPRAIWKDKPVGAPVKRFELYRYGQPLGATFSVPGMGWYYMGYIGVVIWSAIFALIYGFVYNLFIRRSSSNIYIISYMIFLCASIITFRDGLLYTLIYEMIFYLSPVAILAIVARLGGFPGASTMRPSWAGPGATRNGNDLPSQTPRERRLAASAQPATQIPGQIEPSESLTPKQRRLDRKKGA